ncbi:MAG: hypothetical protein HC850_02685, partial [Rhodomicrobium sp.]|nr:hypothetical protein [Rhodomicrobium sp.]
MATIYALSSGHGKAGVAVIRISGPGAGSAVQRGGLLSDLREFLRENAAAVLRVDSPLSVVHEVTALQHALQDANRHPILHIPRPRSASGAEHAMPLV